MSQGNISFNTNSPSLDYQQSPDNNLPLRPGNYQGQKIIQINDQPSLTDCAEEISVQMSEKIESKNFEERTVSSEHDLFEIDEEEIGEYFQSSKGDDAEEKLIEFTKFILNEKNSDPEQRAKESFPDETQQFLALHHALNQATKQGSSPAIIDKLKDAIFDLNQVAGKKIRADLNSISGGAQFGQTAVDVKKFQDTYSDIVLGESNLSKTLDVAIERFNGKDMKQALEQLTKTLGRDLSSSKPSADKTHLTALINDLYHIEVAYSVLERCSKPSNHPSSENKKITNDPTSLMRSLVKLTADRWASNSQFLGLAREHAGSDILNQLHFLTQVRSIVGDIPKKIFVDDDARNSIREGVQKALDQIIDESEQ